MTQAVAPASHQHAPSREADNTAAVQAYPDSSLIRIANAIGSVASSVRDFAASARRTVASLGSLFSSDHSERVMAGRDLTKVWRQVEQVAREIPYLKEQGITAIRKGAQASARRGVLRMADQEVAELVRDIGNNPRDSYLVGQLRKEISTALHTGTTADSDGFVPRGTANKLRQDIRTIVKDIRFELQVNQQARRISGEVVERLQYVARRHYDSSDTISVEATKDRLYVPIRNELLEQKGDPTRVKGDDVFNAVALKELHSIHIRGITSRLETKFSQAKGNLDKYFSGNENKGTKEKLAGRMDNTVAREIDKITALSLTDSTSIELVKREAFQLAEDLAASPERVAHMLKKHGEFYREVNVLAIPSQEKQAAREDYLRLFQAKASGGVLQEADVRFLESQLQSHTERLKAQARQALLQNQHQKRRATSAAPAPATVS